MMKTTMGFCLSTFVALLVFVTAASGAPTWPQDACADVRSSSLELNLNAKTASEMARNRSTDSAAFSSSLDWMDAKDKCDPESLKQNSMTCVGKIFNLLMSYRSEVERISGFQSCLESVRIVKPALEKLHKDMKTCVKSLGEPKPEKSSDISTQHIDHWKEVFLCRYMLDRLFSFSILTARVFAVGDPAHHGGDSTQKCM